MPRQYKEGTRDSAKVSKTLSNHLPSFHLKKQRRLDINNRSRLKKPTFQRVLIMLCQLLLRVPEG